MWITDGASLALDSDRFTGFRSNSLIETDNNHCQRARNRHVTSTVARLDTRTFFPVPPTAGRLRCLRHRSLPVDIVMKLELLHP
jgi:hypothetical protein